MAGCISQNSCILDGICISTCGNNVSITFGGCSPDPDCFAPNCFDNDFCQDSSFICNEECGDGIDTTFGGCVKAPGCEERAVSLTLMVTLITLAIFVLGGLIFFGYIYLIKKQQKLHQNNEVIAQDVAVVDHYK